DVTERKMAEEQLRQANWELARNREELLKALSDLNRSHDALKEAQLQVIQMEKLQLVGRLAAGVAHEVKNPLAVLRMGLDYLASEPASSNPNVAQILQDMKEAIRRADAIILGLLDFSVPGQMDFQPVNLRELVGESLMLVRHEIHEHAVTVDMAVAANVRPLFLDRNKMKQVFVNLFTNAVHAMPEGGVLTIRACERDAAPGEIESNPGARDTETIRRHEPVVAVEIDDTGSGIPDAKLSHVFDPFFTTKPTGEGTGLGLTVTRKIIELHGGGITLRNRPEGGVRAIVLLKTQMEVPCPPSAS
ncbi:MAG TPA: ATP-binding protein, partial [Roseimicrobium sp.]|nr:ATP-binding protein [Roseimicrobium sp.]